MKSWYKKRLLPLLAVGGCTALVSVGASATNWIYLSSPPTESQCSAIKGGSALLVVGADGCTETAPWAGFLNLNGSPTYHSSGVDQATIESGINGWSGMAPNSGSAWAKGWSSTPYASIGTVYVYTPADNMDPGFCGIQPSGTTTWPDLYSGGKSQHINFPWSVSGLNSSGSCGITSATKN